MSEQQNSNASLAGNPKEEFYFLTDTQLGGNPIADAVTRVYTIVQPRLIEAAKTPTIKGDGFFTDPDIGHNKEVPSPENISEPTALARPPYDTIPPAPSAVLDELRAELNQRPLHDRTLADYINRLYVRLRNRPDSTVGSNNKPVTLVETSLERLDRLGRCAERMAEIVLRQDTAERQMLAGEVAPIVGNGIEAAPLANILKANTIETVVITSDTKEEQSLPTSTPGWNAFTPSGANQTLNGSVQESKTPATDFTPPRIDPSQRQTRGTEIVDAIAGIETGTSIVDQLIEEMKTNGGDPGTAEALAKAAFIQKVEGDGERRSTVEIDGEIYEVVKGDPTNPDFLEQLLSGLKKIPTEPKTATDNS
ncbi:MAG TPA: hypothetical protein VLF43_00950 [Candidatus Saccharimonadales bacterium]|nr:hypothetical protein [Candidatus Saccharimonadales bacterium]